MLLLDAAAGSQLQEREWWQNFATAAIVKWALVEAGQCLNQVGQGQYQVSNAPTFLRSVVSSFPILPLL